MGSGESLVKGETNEIEMRVNAGPARKAMCLCERMSAVMIREPQERRKPVVQNVDIAALEGFKTPVKETEIEFKVTPSDLDGAGMIAQSTLYQVSIPLLWAMKLMGMYPYSVSHDGWMRTSFKSITFAYSVLILTLNVACHLYYHDHLIDAWRSLNQDSTFSGVLYSSLLIIQALGVVMSMYSWFFEIGSIAKTYNSTAVLEKKLWRLIPNRTIKPATVTLIKALLTAYLFGEASIAFALLVHRYRNEAIPILIMFTLNFLANQMYTLMWAVNSLFYRAMAQKLENHMSKSLNLVIGRARKIKTCRKAWISIWEQSQMHSESYSVTLLFGLVSYGIILVIACYGWIVSVINSDMDEVVSTIPIFLWSLFLVFTTVETTHQVKKQLGDSFLTKLIHLDKDNMDRECLEEVDKFINVILQADKAQITLKGYFVIDRPLLVSFLSYTVTYMIVLLQFHQSDENSHASNPAECGNLIQ